MTTALAPNVTMIPAKKSLTTADSGGAPLKTLRVAAYARVSTEQEEQQSSYEAQVSYYTQYIKAHPDWELVEVFADEGITGTSTKRREGFNRMIDEARAGKIDLILTKSISRFARNTVDTLTITRELKSLGIEVIFEKENLHTMDPKCEMMLTIMASIAQEESHSISENVRWGKRKSMQDGKVTFAYSRFLGYRKGENGRPEIVPEEAATVRRIYKMFLEGRTFRYIAEQLTTEGIPTPAGKTVWTVSSVRSILSNEKYKGDAILQKTYTEDYLSKTIKKNNGDLPQFYVAKSHPSIIDEDTFDKVQKMLEKQHDFCKKRRGNSPFSNKIICGECGEFYGHKVWHNRDNTGRRDVWYCNRKYSGDEKCKTPVLDEIEIKMAFHFLMKELYEMESNDGVGSDTVDEEHGDAFEYTEERWRKLVDTMTVFPDRKATFKLTDGREASVEF